jgi:uncharacterized membrane protein
LPTQNPSRLVFSTVLRRNRSAHLRAISIIVGVVGTVLTIAGIGFVLAGAWPVIGFCGLEAVLLFVALRLHHHAGREQEIIDVTNRTLSVRRIDHRGRSQDWVFPSFWVQIDPIGAGVEAGPLEIRSHGRSVYVGKWITPVERTRLAENLRHALVPLSAPPALPAPRRAPSANPCAPCRPAAV